MNFQSLPNVITPKLTGSILPVFKRDVPGFDVGTPIEMESVDPSFVKEFTAQQTQASGRNTPQQSEQTPQNSALKTVPDGMDTAKSNDATPAATGEMRFTQFHSNSDTSDPRETSETVPTPPNQPLNFKDGRAAEPTPDVPDQTTESSQKSMELVPDWQGPTPSLKRLEQSSAASTPAGAKVGAGDLDLISNTPQLEERTWPKIHWEKQIVPSKETIPERVVEGPISQPETSPETVPPGPTVLHRPGLNKHAAPQSPQIEIPSGQTATSKHPAGPAGLTSEAFQLNPMEPTQRSTNVKTLHQPPKNQTAHIPSSTELSQQMPTQAPSIVAHQTSSDFRSNNPTGYQPSDTIVAATSPNPKASATPNITVLPPPQPKVQPTTGTLTKITIALDNPAAPKPTLSTFPEKGASIPAAPVTTSSAVASQNKTDTVRDVVSSQNDTSTKMERAAPKLQSSQPTPQLQQLNSGTGAKQNLAKTETIIQDVEPARAHMAQNSITRLIPPATSLPLLFKQKQPSPAVPNDPEITFDPRVLPAKPTQNTQINGHVSVPQTKTLEPRTETVVTNTAEPFVSATHKVTDPGQEKLVVALGDPKPARQRNPSPALPAAMHPIRPPNMTTSQAEPPEISLPQVSVPQTQVTTIGEPKLQVPLPTHAPQIAPQILSSLGPIPTTEPQSLEITLSPKELGKLVLKVQTFETGVQLVIQVERPETLELMRRNVEDLAQELKTAGFQNLSFGDSEARKRANPEHPQESQVASEAPAEQDTEPPKVRQAGPPQSGHMLDLRV